jgi:hypothetical protein
MTIPARKLWTKSFRPEQSDLRFVYARELHKPEDMLCCVIERKVYVVTNEIVLVNILAGTRPRSYRGPVAHP